MQAGGVAQARMRLQQRGDHILVAIERENDVRATFERKRGPGHDDLRPVVPAHRIK